MKKKKFDCVEMKHKAQAIIFAKTKNMTMKQELEYWAKRTEILRKKIEEKKRYAKTA